MNKNNPSIGNRFDDFLIEDAIFDATTATANKRVIAWQIQHEMSILKLNKTAMAKKMHISLTALNRLLDEKDTRLNH